MLFLNMNIGKRLSMMVGLALLVAILLAAMGVMGLSATKESLRTVYEDRMVPLKDLAEIRVLMAENRIQLRTALSEFDSISVSGNKAIPVLDRNTASKAADVIEKNIETISGSWKDYMATYLTPEEKTLADKFSESRGKFVADGSEARRGSLAQQQL